MPARTLSAHALAAGLLAAFVGFASSFAVILQGLTAVGASPAQAASGLMALSIGMGLCGIWLSARSRLPISVAWSTPGAALLASGGAPVGGWPAAVGAFLVCGALLVLAGLWRPLGRWVARIPAPLANAMLAGVLLPLCLAPIRAVQADPASGLPIVLTWALVGRWRRLFAVPAAVVVTVIVVAAQSHGAGAPVAALWPAPVLTVPRLDPAALVGIGLPLFVVTMASQNIPGIAVLAAHGYSPSPGRLLRATGLASLLAAPFGGHAINLAAITAALCAGPDAHPDPTRRWWAAVTAGVGYVGFGLLAGAASVLLAAAPPLLIESVAGLALLGAFGTALAAATAEAPMREAAVLCFVVTASGLSFAGIGGAFWGLLAGGAALGLARLGRRVSAPGLGAAAAADPSAAAPR